LRNGGTVAARGFLEVSRGGGHAFVGDPSLSFRGERDYVDIKLGRTKKPVPFADIALQLTGVDLKKNLYTVQVVADDMVREKKDKAVNEPVQFYTAKGGHTTYVLVITQVARDEIVGYLLVPRQAASR
jgi:hypothetical protein